MLKPVTLAVMEPRLIAASAVVEICPIEMTEAMTRLYSRINELKSGLSFASLLVYQNN